MPDDFIPMGPQMQAKRAGWTITAFDRETRAVTATKDGTDETFSGTMQEFRQQKLFPQS